VQKIINEGLKLHLGYALALKIKGTVMYVSCLYYILTLVLVLRVMSYVNIDGQK
jgi:hypothetical protein